MITSDHQLQITKQFQEDITDYESKQQGDN